jgi:hypothetical protein
MSFDGSQLLSQLLSVPLMCLVLLLQCIHLQNKAFHFTIQVAIYLMSSLKLDGQLLDPEQRLRSCSRLHVLFHLKGPWGCGRMPGQFVLEQTLDGEAHLMSSFF